MLLLDVSKMQPSRGRLYDGIEAFERRLQLFRELSLPMLKTLDTEGRLTIVDGDTEIPTDREQFASALLKLMRRAARHEDDPNRINEARSASTEEEETEVVEDKKKQPNGVAKPVGDGGVRQSSSTIVGNGTVGK